VTVSLNGQIIGQASIATRALLNRELEQAGLTFEQSVALNLAASGGSVTADALAGGLRIPVADAEAALSGLAGAGLLEPDGTITAAGRAIQQQVGARIAGITARLYGDLPADDLVTAARVLTEVTARANAELA
jgi:hypothetical protein